ncbi:MAG: hypothetical protein QUU85_12525, partial [Candidatus Eisenbacteria bacterium]|nr:hypothetical protein [Candidatus Eisenbacteria bacterium]
MKHRVPRAAFPLLPLPPLLLLLPALWLLRPPAASARVLHVEQAGAGRPRGVFTEVQAAIDAAADGDTIRIGEGLFTASTAASIVDPLCGNCLEHRTPVAATAGFRIDGARRLALIGAGAERTVLSTGAGYGIWIAVS